MISRWTLALTMTLAATLPAQSATQIERVTTPGGIEAWLVSDDTLPVVSVQFAFRGGSTQDPAERPGVSRLVSGLLDEGAGDLDAQAFQTRMEESAVELSFDAGTEAFYGRMRTLTERQDEAFELLRLAVTEPRFDPDAIERIRAQLIARLRRDASEPNSIAQRVFYETVFAGQPYGRPTGGTLDSMPQITREDLVRFREKTFARGNLVVVAVGAIDAATLAAKLDEVFGGLPQQPGITPVPSAEVKATGETMVIPLDTPQTTLIFGREGVTRSDPDFIPIYVLNHILGGGSFTSRLFEEVREKRGLTYGVYTGLAPFDAAGLLVGSMSTRNDRAAEAMTVIREEIAKIIAEPPSEEELEKARKYLIGSYPLRFDSSAKIARQLLAIRLDDLGIDYIDRRNALIQAVTRKDLARAARRLLDDGGLFVVAVGRPEGLEATMPPPARSGGSSDGDEGLDPAREP